MWVLFDKIHFLMKLNFPLLLKRIFFYFQFCAGYLNEKSKFAMKNCVNLISLLIQNEKNQNKSTIYKQ